RDLWHSAASIAELASQLGMPQALAATVADFNDSDAQHRAGRLEKPPFVALGPLQAVLVFTDGGLQIDTCMRVLGSAAQPIPGLYAVGAVGQGGMLLDGHGHHIGWAFTSGRLAGRHAFEFSRTEVV
ncbi:MAG: FAD-binding protein, partial [Burkholderiales bacterium]|nr:FAD-binding protein [Burkholderiales bacterium]